MTEVNVGVVANWPCRCEKESMETILKVMFLFAVAESLHLI
jgi:hypothetical protein